MNRKNSVKNTVHYGAIYKVVIPVRKNTGVTTTEQLDFLVEMDGIMVRLKQKMMSLSHPIKEVTNVLDVEVAQEQNVKELEIMLEDQHGLWLLILRRKLEEGESSLFY